MDDLDSGRLVWQRSSHCADNTCVEVAWIDDHVLVRDSKDQSGRVLKLSRREWAAFISGIRDGEFEAP